MLKYDIIYLIKTLGEIMENNNLQTEYRSPYLTAIFKNRFEVDKEKDKTISCHKKIRKK